MSNLQRAIEIAVAAHATQTRKDGTPYILHPLRLMMAVDLPEARIVAVLHDVVEDTDVTLDDLKSEGFSEAIIEAVDCVTHEPNVSYEDYIQRIKGNEIARQVKLADLRDNSDVLQLPSVGDRELSRLAKYHKAFKTLTAAD